MANGQITLDCSACRAPQAMSATKTHRFGGFIRFLGYLIVIPSLLGVLFAIIMFSSTASVQQQQLATATDAAAREGTNMGAGLGYLFSIGTAGASLIGGLVGWLLLTSRRVYKCARCGFILDRA